MIRGKNARFAIGALAGVVAAAAGPSTASAVVVTFSGLNNGINTATDPNNTSTGQPIPSAYQPLMNAYPAPGGNIDGGNIGVTITYANSFVAAKASNTGVNERTHQVTPADNAEVNLYDNGTNPITLTFDKPVTIPSFYYAFFGSGTYSGTFNGFTNAADTTPVASFAYGSFTETAGYNWRQETRLGTTPIQKITFTRNTQYLQLDDLTINAVPEPGSASLAVGAAGLLLARRRRHAAR